MTTQMTTAQARVVDPIISNHIRGYRNARFVARLLAPRVGIQTRGARRIEFDKDSFKKMTLRRAPGSAIQRVQFGYTSEPVALYQEALAGQAPIENMEEAAQVPGISLGMKTAEGTKDLIDLQEEIQTAEQLTDAANYGANNKVALAGGDRWDVANSDPLGDVTAAREAVRSAIGVYPNTAILAPAVFNALKANSQVREQFKYTSSASISKQMLAQFFDLATLEVGEAIYVDTDGTTKDCWDNCMTLGFAQPAANPGMPSFAYTYELEGYPLAEMPWYDRDNRCWVYPVIGERRAYIVGVDAGFLIDTPTG